MSDPSNNLCISTAEALVVLTRLCSAVGSHCNSDAVSWSTHSEGCRGARPPQILGQALARLAAPRGVRAGHQTLVRDPTLLVVMAAVQAAQRQAVLAAQDSRRPRTHEVKMRKHRLASSALGTDPLLSNLMLVYS